MKNILQFDESAGWASGKGTAFDFQKVPSFRTALSLKSGVYRLVHAHSTRRENGVAVAPELVVLISKTVGIGK